MIDDDVMFCRSQFVCTLHCVSSNFRSFSLAFYRLEFIYIMSSQAADLASLGTPQPPISSPPFNVPPAETLTPSQLSQNPSLALEKYKKKDALKGRK
jgi:hypothetical protein